MCDITERQLKELRKEMFGKKPIIPVRRVGRLLFVSGNGCNEFRRGHIGDNLTVQDGYDACRNIVLRILHAVRDSIGSLDRIDQVVNAIGFVNTVENFDQLDKVFDGCSDTLYDIFGDRGICPRTIIGTHNLPMGNTAAEIELIFSLKS